MLENTNYREGHELKYDIFDKWFEVAKENYPDNFKEQERYMVSNYGLMEKIIDGIVVMLKDKYIK